MFGARLSMRIQTPMISWHTSGTLNEPVMCVDVHSSGRFATGGNDNALRIWQFTTTNEDKVELTCVAELERHTKPVNCVRFSPDGSCLASASDDGLIILWFLAPAAEREALEIGESEVKNVENWKTKATLSHGSDVYDICWSFDGTKLLSGSVDSKVIIWSIKNDSGNNSSNSNKIHQVLHEHSNFVQGVTFDPLLMFICSQSNDRTCRVFQLSTAGKAKGTYSQKLVVRSRKRTEDASSNVVEEKEEVNDEEGDEEERKEGAGEIKQHLMYYDELTVPFFVRRLCFSPDGSLLVSPSGRFRDFSNGSSNNSNGEESVNSASESSSSVSDAFFSASKYHPTSYLFVRNQLSRPALSLPCATASVAARFSPVFYSLRHPKEHLGLGLSYRMVFAIATQNSVMIYDTEQINPLAVATNIHLASITDLSWSHDGNMLIVASADGYCTFVMFNNEELGQPLPESEVEAIKGKMEAERSRIRTQLATTAVSAKKKKKAEAEISNSQEGEAEKKENNSNISPKKSYKAKKETPKPLPSIDRWIKPQSLFSEVKTESSSVSSGDNVSVALTMIEETIISTNPSSPAPHASASFSSSPIPRPNFEGSPNRLKTTEENGATQKLMPKLAPRSPLPQPNFDHQKINIPATSTPTSKKTSSKISTPTSTTKVSTPTTKGKTLKKILGCQRIDSWAKPVIAPDLASFAAAITSSSLPALAVSPTHVSTTTTNNATAATSTTSSVTTIDIIPSVVEDVETQLTESPTKSSRKRSSVELEPKQSPKKHASGHLSTITETPPSQTSSIQEVEPDWLAASFPKTTSLSTTSSETTTTTPTESTAVTKISFGLPPVSLSFGATDPLPLKVSTPNVTRLVPRSKRTLTPVTPSVPATSS